MKRMTRALPLLLIALVPAFAFAHNVSGSDARFVEGLAGPAIPAFLYLGAKHMVTGYDHLLYLVGVVFFLTTTRDIIVYVSLFALGHSITLLAGVLAGFTINAFAIDAIIGFSIVYKAFENLDGFRQVFGINPDTRAAVLIFGLCHGLGLATKLQEIAISPDGLVINLVSFNIGVEFGQLLALSMILILLIRWRNGQAFGSQAFVANTVLMTSGFILAGYQLTGLFL